MTASEKVILQRLVRAGEHYWLPKEKLYRKSKLTAKGLRLVVNRMLNKGLIIRQAMNGRVGYCLTQNGGTVIGHMKRIEVPEPETSPVLLIEYDSEAQVQEPTPTSEPSSEPEATVSRV